MTRTIVYFALLLALGCGQQPAVPVTVVNPPVQVAPPAAPQLPDESAVQSWSPSLRSMYQRAREEIEKHYVKLPLESKFYAPVYVDSEPAPAGNSFFGKKATHTQTVGGILREKNEHGVFINHAWTGYFMVYEGDTYLLIDVSFDGKHKRIVENTPPTN